MPKRIRRARPEEGEGNFFLSPSPNVEFIHSGCTLLDLVICGGWALGRVVNIVGDRSTGKTLLAIEAAANFERQYPNGRIWYREAESAFDKGYAEAIGMTLNRVSFRQFDTVEDIFEDLEKRIEWALSHKAPGLYIVDSLDALSDRKAMTRKIDDQGYHLEKAKLMGELFRKLVRPLEEARICVMIISQVRDKINAMFGRKTTRSGGKALDFYASQILYLAHMEKVYKTISGHKRVVGDRIKANCDKAKTGMLPFRQCEFTIRFGYGIDNFRANIEWLMQEKRLSDANLNKQLAEELLHKDIAIGNWEAVTNSVVVNVWREIETSFIPKRKKYGS